MAPWLVLALLTASSGKATSVQVIAAADDFAVVTAARSLQRDLSQQPGVQVVPDVLVAAAPADQDFTAISEAERLLTEVRTHFNALEIGAARDVLSRAQTNLMAHPGSARAVYLLATALRWRGRLDLLDGRAATASSWFACAARLDGSFVPSAEEWPPEARLAYSDAIVAARRDPPASALLHVQPAHAQIWLDGVPLKMGDVTLSSVQPGLHLVAATGVGLSPAAVLARIPPGQEMTEVSLYAENLATVVALKQAASVLAAAQKQGWTNDVALSQALAVLAPHRPLLVMLDARGVLSARWVTQPEVGAPLPSVSVASVPAAVPALMALFDGPTPTSPLPTSAPSLLTHVPWYGWGAGVVIVAGVVAGGIWWARHSRPDRVDLVIEARP